MFMTVDMPFLNGSPLYDYEVDVAWTLIEDRGYPYLVYGYCTSSEMTVLAPRETTYPFTTRLTMRSMSAPEYAGVDEIDVTFHVYSIGTEGVSTNPQEAWSVAKAFIL